MQFLVMRKPVEKVSIEEAERRVEEAKRQEKKEKKSMLKEQSQMRQQQMTGQSGKTAKKKASRPFEDPEAVNIYVRALHRRWGGEWDWDLSLKPVPSSPVRAGFLAGIRRLHRDVHHGLGIEAPVLLCCSTDSTGAGATLDEALRSDVVLSVPQMLARAPFLGDDVTVRQIPGGVHDLALSPEPARSEYLDAVTDWLRAHLG